MTASNANVMRQHAEHQFAEELAELRRQHADLQAKEEGAAAVSRRLMIEINAFRTGAEATKAAYTAAEEAAKTAWHR